MCIQKSTLVVRWHIIAVSLSRSNQLSVAVILYDFIVKRNGIGPATLHVCVPHYVEVILGIARSWSPRVLPVHVYAISL